MRVAHIGILLAALIPIGCAENPPIRLYELPVREPGPCFVDLTGGVSAVDVAVAIDASRSTLDPSGADIDENGRVGALEDSVMTDPADSRLAAQVAAVRSLLRGAPWTDARFSIVAFAGRLDEPAAAQSARVGSDQAVVIAPLTDVARELRGLEDALDRVLARGGAGTTQFSAGMRRALETLDDAPPSPAEPRRLMLLMSDSPHPIMIAVSEERGPRLDPLMKRAARRAIRAGIPIHTFGLANAATAETPHSLSRIASATGGTFTPVPDPQNLHCHLLRAVAR